MKIYTKTGDDGTTAVFGGRRVLKNDPQISAYGAVDELSSHLGLIIVRTIEPEDEQLLTDIQKTLYQIMAFLSGSIIDPVLLETETLEIEKRIDEFEKNLLPLTKFILPQGSEVSSLFHIVRAVCRRAEREVTGYYEEKTLKINHPVIQYLNRLSDLFFVMARYYNKKKEVSM